MKSSEEEKDSAAAGARVNASGELEPTYEEGRDGDDVSGDSDYSDDESESSGDESEQTSTDKSEDDDEIRSEFTKQSGSTPRNVLEGFSVTPEMIRLFEALREIHDKAPQECPEEIRLIVFTYECIEFGLDLDKPNEKELMEVIEHIRKQWGKLGRHINLGDFPNGSAIHVLTAFATKDCLKLRGVNKMKEGNHTLKYMLHNILLDFFRRIGYDVTGKEVQEFFLEKYTRSDGCVFCGTTGKGNKQVEYLKQTNEHFETFCTRFEDELKIEGEMEIDRKKYTHYKGFHIVAAAGLLDVILRAMLTKAKAKAGQKLHLLVHSLRMRRLFFIVKTDSHVFDVLENEWLIICPFIHPNYHQCYLTCYKEDEVHKLDISYSTAFRALEGEEIGEEVIELGQNFPADSSMRRWDMRRDAGKENRDRKEEILALKEEVLALKKEAVKLTIELRKKKRQLKMIERQNKRKG